MRKGKSLLNLTVVGQSDGTQLGHVRDLIFDHEADQVLGLVLNEKDLFGLIDAQVVPWNQVRSIGSDTILVESSHSKIHLKDDERMRQVTDTHREAVLSGTRILTVDGRQLGTLADTFIEETTGRVLGYEVSGGFIADTLRGKKFLPAPPPLTVGQDAAIAPPEDTAKLENLPR